MEIIKNKKATCAHQLAGDSGCGGAWGVRAVVSSSASLGLGHMSWLGHWNCIQGNFVGSGEWQHIGISQVWHTYTRLIPEKTHHGSFLVWDYLEVIIHSINQTSRQTLQKSNTSQHTSLEQGHSCPRPRPMCRAPLSKLGYSDSPQWKGINSKMDSKTKTQVLKAKPKHRPPHFLSQTPPTVNSQRTKLPNLQH